MDTTLLATENGIKNQNQTNLDKMSNLIILNDGTILDNKYEIIREIARGGMGIVYEAYNIHNYKTVAIKMILSNNIESPQLKRFQKEIEAYSLLSHPNVIRIYDAGVYNNYPYIVMEYIKGVDICTYVKQHNATDWKLCARLIYETALGLEYIHSQKMIHRDIKPSNIIVRPNGSPVIIDLGVVKFNRSQSYNLTQSKEVIGTIEYMPIEQAQGKSGQIDVRTDVYSLGLVLYELLTEQRAYSGENLMELCYKIMSYYPPLPRKINPKIPEVLEEITLHAIEKQKEKRYASMKTFANALKEYLSGTKVKSISHYDKWIEKRERVFSIYIAVILAIILAIVVSMIVIVVSLTTIKPARQNSQASQMIIDSSPSKNNVKQDNENTETQNFTSDSENNQSYNYELLLESANQGDAEAQYNLGIMYQNGEYVQKDLEIACYWFEKAAYQNHAESQYNLGIMYQNGQGIGKNLQQAIEWFEKAADLGHKEAQSNLEYMPIHIRAENLFNLGSIYENRRDSKTAFKWFKKSAELGHKKAQYNLGHMYFYGKGVGKNVQKAEYWHKKVAEQGNKVDQYELGNLYFYGRGVGKNVQKAIEWYTKIAEQGDAVAQYKLGEIYFYGHGVAKDLQKAIYWYEKVAKQGDKEAQYKLGVMYFYGQGVEKDLQKAKYWLQKVVSGIYISNYYDSTRANAKKILKEIEDNEKTTIE